MKFQFNKTYFLFAFLLLVTEAFIAIYFKTGFIRHTFGDYLCVILLYCFFKSFIKGLHVTISLIVLAIAFCIEFLQLTNYLELFDLNNNDVAKLFLGSTFEVTDLVAYSLGIISVLILEKKLKYKSKLLLK
ncbi:DUF2809 domain-containing protein [Algibacter luteus]|uniref:ribosomal maturation YjgA family protein n=1 Tax=Algibacter luteus TaxID=1178825 RepID=UPI0025926907|nr:DUF2809 domain-containing protein [Algibacter luteus]WJJ96104.1 DUF2809 domain-containing protein [Algibacter luteus]